MDIEVPSVIPFKTVEGLSDDPNGIQCNVLPYAKQKTDKYMYHNLSWSMRTFHVRSRPGNPLSES